MMRKLFVTFVALLSLSLSGCCRYFGLCASASVSTSITPTQQYVLQDGTEGNAGIQQARLLALAPVSSAGCAD